MCEQVCCVNAAAGDEIKPVCVFQYIRGGAWASAE